MTEWIKCSEKLPQTKRNPCCIYATDEKYDILIVINGKYLIGRAIYFNGATFYLNEDIIFCLASQTWMMPSHFRQPDYWMEITLPKEDLHD